MSESRIDAVLSYHMNPHTCGVAKFNHKLAKELGVLCDATSALDCYKHPLISIKTAEMGNQWILQLPCIYGSFDLFLHDVPNIYLNDLASWPRRIYAANRVIAETLRPIRPDVIEAWCPSTIEGNPTRGTINVLTFGMAHKLQTERYAKLKTLLDATGTDYTVSVSTAVHEGSPWDETAAVGDRLRSVFGDHLRVLGYLADDALARELQDCTSVAMFFDPALRANNTTFWAALSAGKPVITNTDVDSPLVNGLFSIEELGRWPQFERIPEYMEFGEIDSGSRYGWKRLVETIQGQPCAK